MGVIILANSHEVHSSFWCAMSFMRKEVLTLNVSSEIPVSSVLHQKGCALPLNHFFIFTQQTNLHVKFQVVLCIKRIGLARITSLLFTVTLEKCISKNLLGWLCHPTGLRVKVLLFWHYCLVNLIEFSAIRANAVYQINNKYRLHCSLQPSHFSL